MSIDQPVTNRERVTSSRAGMAKIWVTAALVMTAMLVVAGVWLMRGEVTASGADDEAIRFLEMIRTGEVDRAWEDTTPEFKSFLGRDRFRKTVKANPAFQHPSELASNQWIDIGPLKLVECLFQSNHSSSAQIRVLVAPVKSGQWKVERVEIQTS